MYHSLSLSLSLCILCFLPMNICSFLNIPTQSIIRAGCNICLLQKLREREPELSLGMLFSQWASGSFLISKSYWSQDQGLDANKPEYKIDLDVCCFSLLSTGQFLCALAFFRFISAHSSLSYSRPRFFLSLSLSTLLNLGSFNYILKLQYHLHFCPSISLHFDLCDFM